MTDLAPRPIEPADLSVLLALNNAHAVELSLLDAAGFQRLLANAAFAAAIGSIGAPAAFLVAFSEATPPQGPNHAWFLARHPRLLYIDRVCVAPAARGRGSARALYEAAFNAARKAGAPVVCCEVNTEPPNPGSDAFHAAMGFNEIGRQVLAERNKAVRYLEHTP